MQKHRKSYKILQFLILEICVHLRNLRRKAPGTLFGRSINNTHAGKF